MHTILTGITYISIICIWTDENKELNQFLYSALVENLLGGAKGFTLGPLNIYIYGFFFENSGTDFVNSPENHLVMSSENPSEVQV